MVGDFERPAAANSSKHTMKVACYIQLKYNNILSQTDKA